jgi:DNA polymerase/3'-5' exonuclease PolX
MSTSTNAMSLRTAQEESARIVAILEPHCERIEVAGSVRRGRTWINDIEIVCIAKQSVMQPEQDLFGSPMGSPEIIRDHGFVEAVHGLAATIVKGKPATGRYVQFLTSEGIKVDLFMATTVNWGYIMAIRTGSADFSKMLATRWVSLGYKGEDGNLTRSGQVVRIESETAMFGALGMRVPVPQERELTADGLKKWIING